MTDQNNQSSQGDGNTITDDKQNQTDQQGTQGGIDSSKFVPVENHERALQDMHKYKNELNKLKSQLEADNLKRLKETEQWQSVAEMKEKEAMEALEEAERIKGAYINDRKMSAIREAAQKAGILPQALNDLELLNKWDDVSIETTSTGRVNVIGAEQALNKFKASKPYLFGKPVPKIGGEIPGVTAEVSEITYDKLQKLKQKAQSGEKSDMEAYKKAYMEYGRKLASQG